MVYPAVITVLVMANATWAQFTGNIQAPLPIQVAERLRKRRLT